MGYYVNPNGSDFTIVTVILLPIQFSTLIDMVVGKSIGIRLMVNAC
jgi:hypothetical protein